MSVTIKDIGNLVGVSASTVSIVLNGKATENRISREMENKILVAAKKLDYKPNILARGLRKGKIYSIGFIISDLSNAFFVKLVRQVEQMVLNYGYKLFFAGTDENDDRCKEVIDTFLNFKMDGLIIAATSGIEDTIKQLSLQKVPFVLIDRYFPEVDTNYVIMNNWQSSYDAVTYLIKKGKKRIATFSYNTPFFHMNERMMGYKAALNDNGIEFDEKIIPEISFLTTDYEIIKNHMKFLVLECKIDGIFFQTNRVAFAGIKALYELNAETKVMVVCFDDNDFFKLLRPPVSALSQPVEQLGSESVRILIDEINSKRKNYMLNKTIYTARLIER